MPMYIYPKVPVGTRPERVIRPMNLHHGLGTAVVPMPEIVNPVIYIVNSQNAGDTN